MYRLKLQAKFLGLVLGSLVVFFCVLSYVIVQREAGLLDKKGVEKQRIIAYAIFTDLKKSMISGRPRSTLDLMRSLKGRHGLVRLETLRRNGSPAFGIKGSRYALPQIETAFNTGLEIAYHEHEPLPLHTILFPLKNDKDCRSCHSGSGETLGVIMLSLSRDDIIAEISRSRRNLIAILSLLTLLVGGVLYIVIRKVILTPLAALHEGAELLGSGNMSHRISVNTNDEMQGLAGAMNIMAGRLEEMHSGLESRIRERTLQLYDAVVEVKDKARRLFYYSRDMAAISRLSTKIFNAELSMNDLLDRFMWSITRGLGYKRTMLCLVDRKRAWLDIKREAGMNELLKFNSQPLSGNDPLARLVRTSRVVLIDDITKDAEYGLEIRPGIHAPLSLYVIPILSRRHSKKCWQIKSCIKTDCPAYRSGSDSCWLVKDTLCGNILAESFGDKLTYCMTCQVFPVVGVLLVTNEPQRRAQRNRNVGVLRILASEMGAALENQELHERNQQMVKELLELHRVTAVALSDLSLGKALEAFTDSTLKFSGLDACNFWLASDNGRELIRKAGGCTLSDAEDDCPERLPVDSGLIGLAFNRNNIVVEYNAPLRDATLLGPALARHDLNAILAVPLRTESRPIGVFSVHKKSNAPFLETEIAAFMLLANQAAMAINVCVLSEELKGQNRELVRSTNLMSGMLASMSSGVMLLDMNGMVRLINHQGAGILGLRRDDILNRRLTDFFHETEAFVRSDIGPYQEMEILMPDGKNLPVGFSSAYYNGASGEPEGVIVVYRDLTEIKALQAELLNKERFAAMGRVVAGAAHEIRNPLFGISTIGQIFEKELKRPAHQELVRALLSETRRLNQLVEELLIYGRPMKLNLQQCDLRLLWEEVLEMHGRELELRRIRVTGDYGLRHPVAYLDSHQIKQVFLNILRNSIDAMPGGGDINIRLLIEDKFIIFRIVDTGAGIPQENMDKVFDLFFTTKPKGTGLGLAICKKIVEDHGGEIRLASDPGKGASVTIRLPYRPITDRQKTQAATY